MHCSDGWDKLSWELRQEARQPPEAQQLHAKLQAELSSRGFTWIEWQVACDIAGSGPRLSHCPEPATKALQRLENCIDRVPEPLKYAEGALKKVLINLVNKF